MHRSSLAVIILAVLLGGCTNEPKGYGRGLRDGKLDSMEAAYQAGWSDATEQLDVKEAVRIAFRNGVSIADERQSKSQSGVEETRAIDRAYKSGFSAGLAESKKTILVNSYNRGYEDGKAKKRNAAYQITNKDSLDTKSRVEFWLLSGAAYLSILTIGLALVLVVGEAAGTRAYYQLSMSKILILLASLAFSILIMNPFLLGELSIWLSRNGWPAFAVAGIGSLFSFVIAGAIEFTSSSNGKPAREFLWQWIWSLVLPIFGYQMVSAVYSFITSFSGRDTRVILLQAGMSLGVATYISLRQLILALADTPESASTQKNGDSRPRQSKSYRKSTFI